MANRKRRSATNDNLLRYGLAPAMRWLIAVALDGSTITYGELKRKLEDEAGFSTIFATRIGFVAGHLMDRIQEVEPNAPLINVLVVNQNDRQPSKGAGSFMARHFDEPRLDSPNAKQKYPQLWENSFRDAAGEVYAYSEDDWVDLFEHVFDTDFDSRQIKRERDKRQAGAEDDGIQFGRQYGRGGEGPMHKALRLWVMKNPAEIHSDFADAAIETEVDLDSGDRVDVVYKLDERIIVLEVKSRRSNDVDLRRGIFQCVKYRAVRKAMDVRDDAVIEAYLVTEMPLPGEISALVKRHNINHKQVSQERS